MKSKIYRIIVVLILSAFVFDWPVPSSAGGQAALIKGCQAVKKVSEMTKKLR